jgi:hypothetical protein
LVRTNPHVVWSYKFNNPQPPVYNHPVCNSGLAGRPCTTTDGSTNAEEFSLGSVSYNRITATVKITVTSSNSVTPPSDPPGWPSDPPNCPGNEVHC